MDCCWIQEINIMENNTYNFEKLISLLELKRSDDRIDKFIEQLSIAPEVYIDKDDGADVEYIEFKEYGFCLYFDEGILDSIFIYSEKNDEDYEGYSLSLPMGISFNNSKSDLIKLLGVPSSKGGGVFKNILPWIKYIMNGYNIHFEFIKRSKSIKMITIEKEESYTD